MIRRVGPFGCPIYVRFHLHIAALDGVDTKDGEIPRLHEVSAPSCADMQGMPDAIVSRVLRRLEHDGLMIRDSEQCWRDLESRDALDMLMATSIHHRIAVRPPQGRRTLTLKPAAPGLRPRWRNLSRRYAIASR